MTSAWSEGVEFEAPLPIDYILAKQDARCGDGVEFLVRRRHELSWERETRIEDKAAIQDFEQFQVPKWSPYTNLKSRPSMEKARCFYEDGERPIKKNQIRLCNDQRVALNWLIFRFSCSQHCILSDEIGESQTSQSACVSFLAHLGAHHNIRGPFLIVAPKGLLGQWKRHLEQWTDLTVLLYHGDSARVRDLSRKHELFYPGTRQARFGVCITTFEHVGELTDMKWTYLIADDREGHHRHNEELMGTVAKLKVQRRILLIGQSQSNSSEEFLQLLMFLEPGEPRINLWEAYGMNLSHEKEAASYATQVGKRILRLCAQNDVSTQQEIKKRKNESNSSDLENAPVAKKKRKSVWPESLSTMSLAELDALSERIQQERHSRQ